MPYFYFFLFGLSDHKVALQATIAHQKFGTHSEHCELYRLFNKLTSVFHASVLFSDHEFRYNIVKVTVDPRGDSRVDPQTTLTILWRNSLSITGQTHEKLTSISFFTITICQIVRSRLMPHRINYKFMCLSAY